MAKGIAFALGACFIWGLIYVVPQFMEGFSSMEIALGRYLVYGVVSSFVFLYKRKIERTCKYPMAYWIRALYFSLISTMIYYIFLVLALRYSSPAICALILGTSPITIAYYGNWKQKEIEFKKLLIPSLLILAGLVIINVPHLLSSSSFSQYGLGLIFSLISLASWSWYVVANARFLKSHPELPASHWCTLIGMGTFFWALLLGVILLLFFAAPADFAKYSFSDSRWIHFWVGSLVLGLFCSWVAEFLWNRASFYLPVSLAGQLTILESVFAVFFVFLLDWSVPSLIESGGMAIQMMAILYGIQQFSRKSIPETATVTGIEKLEL